MVQVHTTYIIGVLLCCYKVLRADFEVTLVSDPEGPVYQAGTLLSFKCGFSGDATPPITYEWTAHCSESSEIVLAQQVVNDPYWPGEPILTTPNICLNEIFCGVIDSTNRSDYRVIYIDDIIGAGLTYGGVPISNNTLIVTVNSTFASAIGCHSGSLDSNNGVWIMPDGSELSQSNNIFIVDRNNATAHVHSFISLSVRKEIKLSSSMSGIYKCLINDIDGFEQVLSFQLFIDNLEGVPNLISHNFFVSDALELKLVCVFEYSYGSIDWYVDGALVSSNGGYSIETTTLNTTATVHESVLTILDTDATGEYQCSLTTHMVLDEQVSMNTVDYYFIVQPVGAHHMVPCHFKESVTATEVLRNGEVLIPKENGNMVKVSFEPIQDSDQGHLYSCIGDGPNGLVYLNFTVITTVGTIPLSVSFVMPPVHMAGDPAELTCTAQIIIPGYNSLPLLAWYSNLQNFTVDTTFSVLSTATNDTAMSVASISSVPTSLAGSYLCIVHLITPALQLNLTSQLALTQVEEHPLRIQLPSSDIEIASDLDTVYVGGNATFTCTINASAAIDTPIRADVTWYSGSIASQFNSSNDNVTIKTVPESNLYHVSTLTIGAVSRVAIQAGVGCAAVLYPADGQPPEIEPSAVEQTDISVTILDPDITVTIMEGFTISVPGTPPYNSFPLTCIVEEPSYLQVQSSINWMRGGTVLDISNGHRVNQTYISPTQRHLVLHIDDATTGNYSFQCVSTLTILPGDSPVIHSATVDVEIRESTEPIVPIGISVTRKHAREVGISWIVPSVSYTQETYVIQYGLSANELVLTSESVLGNSDITLNNQLYSLSLVDLQDNTTYFYKIIADNSFFTTETVVNSFTTPSLSLSIELQASETNDVIMAGMQYSLGCVVTLLNSTLSSPNITLYGPDSLPVTNSTDLVITYASADSGDVTVTLDIVTHTSHAGRYRCEAVLSNGEQADVTEHLIVRIPTPALNLTITPSPYTNDGIYEGHDVTLLCQVELSVYVDTPVVINSVWRLNGEVVQPSNKIKIEPFNSTLGSILRLEEIGLDSRGEYVCTVTVSKGGGAQGTSDEIYILPAVTAANTTVPIKELPSHNVSTAMSGTPLAGEPLNLTCMVSASDSLLQHPVVHWSGPAGQIILPESADAVPSDPITMDGVIHLFLYFPIIRTSQAGNYMCHAVSNISTLGLVRETTGTQLVRISIPSPHVYIELTPFRHGQYHAGSALNLTCVTILSPAVDMEVSLITIWEAPVVISANSTRVLEHNAVQDTNHTYHSVLQFHTLSRSRDAGLYKCMIAIVPVRSPNVIQSLFATTTTTINIASPQLSLSINPVTSYVLDTDLYNTFVIQCVADVPDDVLSLKQFTWRIISKDSQTLGIISHNNTEGFMINQTDYPDSKVSVSELTGVLDMAGSYMITCDAVLDILEDSNQPLSTMEYDLIARSPSLPNSVINITAAKGDTVDSSVISWAVDQLAYTPEQYVIKYSTDSSSLSTISQPLSSGDDIYLTNAVYRQEITDLSVGSTYYYQILSSNSEGARESGIMSFVAGFESTLFQLKLEGINRCTDWVFDDANNKKRDLVDAISEAIQEICDCHVPANHIQEGQFLCMGDSSQVLFRGRVYRTQEYSSQALVQFLQEWRARGQTVVIASTRLQVDAYCQAMIDSFNDPNCEEMPSPAAQGFSSTIYIVIAVAGGLVLAIVIATVCLCVFCRSNYLTRKKEQEELQMREAIHNATLQPLSPVPAPRHNLHYKDKFDVYMSPSPSTFKDGDSLPPYYMSPGKPTGFDRPIVPTGYSIPSATSTPRRDSHIYHTSTPPGVNPSKSFDPIYEPVPGDDGTAFDDHKGKPPVPERMSIRKDSCTSYKSPLRLGSLPGHVQSRSHSIDQNDGSNTREEDEDDDYEYMRSVGSISIPGLSTM